MSVASRTPATRLRFANFEVDFRTGELWKSGVRIRIQDQPFRILQALLEHPGELLSRAELKERIWPDIEYGDFDHALNLAINKLRSALGDSADTPRLIETVPRHGYRFLLQVEVPATNRAEVACEANASDAVETASTNASALPAKQHLRDGPPYRRLRWWGKFIVICGIAAVAIILALPLLVRRLATTVNLDPELRAVQITSSTGLDAFASFSPDGRNIAYSSDKTGDLEIFIRQLSAVGSDLQLTSDRQQNIQPAWSPDGQWIAYHSAVRGGIWMIPALGGASVQLTDFGERPAWSPDGSRIAFQSQAPPAIAEAELGGRKESTIWTVSLRNGKLSQLTRPDSPRSASVYGHSSPAWSPDGQWIVFTAGSAIACVNPDTAASAVALERGAAGLIFDAVLTADGKNILYGGNAGENAVIWSLPVDNRCHATGMPKKLYVVGPNRARYLVRSADGRHLAYTVLRTSADLYSVLLPEPGHAGTPEPTPFVEDTRFRKTLPIFSPDGTHVAYMVHERNAPSVGGGGPFWVVNADGSNAKRVFLVEDAGVRGACSWLSSSDAFLCITRNHDVLQLWRVDLATGRSKFLGPANIGKKHLFPRLSPDNSKFAYFTESNGTRQIEITRVDGAQPVVTIPSAQFPSWSHDGRWLAVEVNEGTNDQIAVVPASGGPLRMITTAPGKSWPHDWSPADDKIAFAGFRNGVWNIYSVTRATGVEEQLTHYSTPAGYVRYPTWSPKGRQIVYELARTRGNIWTLELPQTN